MKNIKSILFKCSGLLCAAAMFVAVHSVNVTCQGKYYQPKAPKEMDKFKRN